MAGDRSIAALSDYQRDLEARHRAWFGRIVGEIRRRDEAHALARLPIHASYADWFFPIHFVDPAGHPHRAPVVADLAALADSTTSERPVARLGLGFLRLSISFDAGGAFVRDNRTDRLTRDPVVVSQLLGTSPVRDFVLPQLAAPEQRRRREDHVVAEAFVYWGLTHDVGPIRATRLILAWGTELQAPWRRSRPGIGRLARLRLEGRRLESADVRRLRTAERAVDRSCRRARPALGRFDPT